MKAFPVQWKTTHGTQSVNQGMDLRDYFAAKALQGMLAGNYQGDIYMAAQNAYRFADAMIHEREQDKEMMI